MQRELGQEDRRDLVWGAASNSARELFALDQVRGDREVAGEKAISTKEHVGACALAGGITSVVRQPFVELQASTVERGQIVTGRERLDRVAQAGLIR
jgi:hypothetical protein